MLTFKIFWKGNFHHQKVLLRPLLRQILSPAANAVCIYMMLKFQYLKKAIKWFICCCLVDWFRPKAKYRGYAYVRAFDMHCICNLSILVEAVWYLALFPFFLFNLLLTHLLKYVAWLNWSADSHIHTSNAITIVAYEMNSRLRCRPGEFRTS